MGEGGATLATHPHEFIKEELRVRGPGEASGWNWTPLNGFERCRIPSLVPSLALENQGSQSGGSVSSSTA